MFLTCCNMPVEQITNTSKTIFFSIIVLFCILCRLNCGEMGVTVSSNLPPGYLGTKPFGSGKVSTGLRGSSFWFRPFTDGCKHCLLKYFTKFCEEVTGILLGQDGSSFPLIQINFQALNFVLVGSQQFLSGKGHTRLWGKFKFVLEYDRVLSKTITQISSL